MSLDVVSSLRGALGVPTTKVPISTASFVSYVFPPMVCYILVAVLAVTPQTRTVRIALCPVVASLTFRAVSSVDMSIGDPGQKYLNVDLLVRIFEDESLTVLALTRVLRPSDSHVAHDCQHCFLVVI